MSVQGPIVLADDTEPEPDLAIYRRRTPPYKEREAFADAAAGIPEYWVVDCTAESIEVHRTPDAGGYRDVSRVTGATTVSLQAFPDVALTLAEVFA